MKTDKKIEEIIKEYSYFLGDGDEYNFNMPKVIEELTNLLTQQREEADRGFITWFWGRDFPDNKKDFMNRANEYLQSLDKGDKDENR